MSPPDCALRSRTNSTSPPSITVEPDHSRVSGADVATYLATDDSVLRRDHGREVGIHRAVPVGHELVAVLGNTVERQQLIHRDSGTRRREAATTSGASGALIRKTQRQDATRISQPPSSGPIAVATPPKPDQAVAVLQMEVDRAGVGVPQ